MRMCTALPMLLSKQDLHSYASLRKNSDSPYSSSLYQLHNRLIRSPDFLAIIISFPDPYSIGDADIRDG
jgi:hypothetical protein